MRYALEDHDHGAAGWEPIGWDPEQKPGFLPDNWPWKPGTPKQYVGLGRPDIDQLEHSELFDAPVGSLYLCVNPEGNADYSSVWPNNGARLWLKIDHTPRMESIPTREGERLGPDYVPQGEGIFPEQGYWLCTEGDTGEFTFAPGWSSPNFDGDKWTFPYAYEGTPDDPSAMPEGTTTVVARIINNVSYFNVSATRGAGQSSNSQTDLIYVSGDLTVFTPLFKGDSSEWWTMYGSDPRVNLADGDTPEWDPGVEVRFKGRQWEVKRNASWNWGKDVFFHVTGQANGGGGTFIEAGSLKVLWPAYQPPTEGGGPGPGPGGDPIPDSDPCGFCEGFYHLGEFPTVGDFPPASSFGPDVFDCDTALASDDIDNVYVVCAGEWVNGGSYTSSGGGSGPPPPPYLRRLNLRKKDDDCGGCGD